MCLFIFLQFTNGQTFSFKNYGAENNIPSGVIYTIDQSNDGFLWVGTEKGLARFDGYDFFYVQFPDSSQLRYPSSSLKDKNGTLWFGCNDGSLYHTDKITLSRLKSHRKDYKRYCGGPDGLIYVVPQGKAIFSINPERSYEIQQYSLANDPVLYSAAFAGNGKLLIGTLENLLICNLEKDSVSVQEAVEGFDYSAVTSIVQTADSSDFVIGTDGNGLFKLQLSERGNSVERFQNHKELEALRVQSMIRDSGKNIWISTYGSGAIQISLSENSESIKSTQLYNTNSGLATDDVKTVFQDIEGNYWIGTYGLGISMLTSYAFGYYMPGENSLKNNIIYVNGYKEKYLLGTPSGFHLFDSKTGKSLSFTDLARSVGNTEITSYFLDKDDNLWIGTGGKGLYLRTGSGAVRKFFSSGDSGLDFIKDIEVENQNIWLATTNGVLVVDKNKGTEKQRFDINNGLPHNSINKIMVAKNGTVYIGTESDRLYSIDKDFKIIQGSGIMYGSTLNKILAFAQGNDGVVWAATNSNGVFRFLNDSITALNRSNDLMSNYCYSILADSENNIWMVMRRDFQDLTLLRGPYVSLGMTL
ncbi:MAG: hypothetical protein IPJ37_14995 [Bacteroidales bacterium]|nr:hypothetical protein [Bacteroidales bacterium]